MRLIHGLRVLAVKLHRFWAILGPFCGFLRHITEWKGLFETKQVAAYAIHFLLFGRLNRYRNYFTPHCNILPSLLCLTDSEWVCTEMDFKNKVNWGGEVPNSQSIKEVRKAPHTALPPPSLRGTRKALLIGLSYSSHGPDLYALLFPLLLAHSSSTQVAAKSYCQVGEKHTLAHVRCDQMLLKEAVENKGIC